MSSSHLPDSHYEGDPSALGPGVGQGQHRQPSGQGLQLGNLLQKVLRQEWAQRKEVALAGVRYFVAKTEAGLDCSLVWQLNGWETNGPQPQSHNAK